MLLTRRIQVDELLVVPNKLALGTGDVVQGRSAGRLVIEGGPQSGRAVALRGSRLRIGALEENDLVLNQPEVSRFHAQIHVHGRSVEIEDLGSKNGTFVGGERVIGEVELCHGDEIQIGRRLAVLRFIVDDGRTMTEPLADED